MIIIKISLSLSCCCCVLIVSHSLLFFKLNLILLFPSWRRASVEAAHPGIAFFSPWRCSFWPLSASPSNGHPISVTMPTSLGKVYNIGGEDRRGEANRAESKRSKTLKLEFGRITMCVCVWGGSACVFVCVRACVCLCVYSCVFEGVWFWQSTGTFRHLVTQTEPYLALKSACAHRCRWG